MPLAIFLCFVLAVLILVSGAVGAIPVGASALLALGTGSVALLEHTAARL